MDACEPGESLVACVVLKYSLFQYYNLHTESCFAFKKMSTGFTTKTVFQNAVFAVKLVPQKEVLTVTPPPNNKTRVLFLGRCRIPGVAILGGLDFWIISLTGLHPPKKHHFSGPKNTENFPCDASRHLQNGKTWPLEDFFTPGNFRVFPPVCHHSKICWSSPVPPPLLSPVF